MTETLALIGSGNIGSAVARLAVAAGLNVVLSNSRGPETLADLVAELGEHARATTPTKPHEQVTWSWRPSHSRPTSSFPPPPWQGRP
jgi:predicted dinucleotide-binding enzyme